MKTRNVFAQIRQSQRAKKGQKRKTFFIIKREIKFENGLKVSTTEKECKVLEKEVLDIYNLR